MIKLQQLIPEVVRLNSIKEIDTIKNELAAAAQKEYDDWVQDEEGHNEELGSGGICHLIADRLIDVLYNHGINRCQTVSSCHEQHVYVVGQFREGIYLIDVPYSYYERGGGFTWKKIPNVQFSADHIEVQKLDGNPRSLKQYTDQMESMEYPLAGKKDLQSFAGYEGWKGKVIWMSPDKFLKLASPLQSPEDHTLRDLEVKIKKNHPIDFLMLKVDPERKKVIGHEGRHRAMVSKKLGIEKVPVLILVHIWNKRVPSWGQEEHDFVDKADWEPQYTTDDKLEEAYKGGIPRYLYHATYWEVTPQIFKKGLNPDAAEYVNYEGNEKGVYMTPDKLLAVSMVETSENENIPEEWLDDIIVLVIDLHKLDDKRLFEKDPPLECR